MRVLHVLEAAGFGTGQHLRLLVSHVHGVDHHVAVPRTRHRGGEHRLPTIAGELDDRVTVHTLPLRRNPAHPDTLRSLVALARIVRDIRPDVIHGHSSIGGALARLVAWRAGVPAVWTPHGLRTDRAALAAERRLAPLTDRLVAVSPSEAAQVVSRGLAAPARVRTILNPVDPAPPPEPEPGVRELLGLGATPVVGFVGRLGQEKGADVLVDAVELLRARLPQVQVVMVAVGPRATAFDRDVERRGLTGRIHRLPGWPDAAGLMPEFDVLAVPSRREAGPSFVALEAMQAKTPVVMTDVIGLCDGVDDGVDGLVVPPDDPAALAAALQRVLVDPDLARRLGSTGADRVRSRHGLAAFVAAHERLYADLAVSARS